MGPDRALLDRFRDALGVGQEPPSAKGLARVVRAHLAALLAHMGYDADLCGADMATGEDVHAVVIVRVEDREYLVDAGYGAPFYEPIPRDLTVEHSFAFGNERYVLYPRDDRGRSRMEHDRDRQVIHGYVAKPTPRPVEHFDAVVRDSFRPAATFMNALQFIRFEPERSVRLTNDTLVVSTPDSVVVQKLSGRLEILGTLEARLGVARDIAEVALGAVGDLHDIHG